MVYFGLVGEGNNTVLAESPLYRPEYQRDWAGFDLEAANRLLDELGLVDRDDRGIRLMRDGRPLEILVQTAGESTEQTDVLDRMLKTLVPYAARYDFAVEGHTDSIAFENGGRTNWDLSTDRANAVRTRLAAVGVGDKRIKVEGYADTVPLPEEALEGLTEDEILARHRRVVVRVN